MVGVSSGDVVVVGGGIAGVACARALQDAGVSVRLVDRGRRLGGRMGSRRLAGRPVDLGASYFTVSDTGEDEGFGEVVRGWAARDLARPWTDTFTVLDATGGDAPQDKPGPVRWGTPASLRSLVEDLAEGLDVEARAVERVDAVDGGLEVDGTPVRALVAAMPDAQAVRLLGPGLAHVASRLDRASDPQIALAAWWPERTWDHLSPSGTFHGALVNGDDALSWVADDGRRRGDDAPCLVAHSTPELAARHLDDPDGARAPMLAALQRLLGVPDPEGTHVHRWSLAKPRGEREDPYLLDGGEDGRPLVGVCGDGWGPASKVEGAWLSGHRIGTALATRLG